VHSTPLPLDALPPGFIIANRYEVVAHLGKGGQGVVYSVFDHHLQEESALKIMTSIGAGGVWREASLLTQLSGKFLLPVRNADLAQGVPFVVTEIARHGTTWDRMTVDVGVPTERAVQWVIHASRGASRMHDHSLVHNDLKPENLFLDSKGDALLGDLGFASELKASGYAALTGGTPATMSPEVAEAALHGAAGGTVGEPCSVASDVYSLGATLYWLLLGRAPYVGVDHLAVLAQVVAGPPPSLGDLAPHVPRSIVDTVDRAMSRLPADRFSSASDLDYALAKQLLPKRHWSKQPSHPGHSACFLGQKGKSTLAVCASETGSGNKVSVEVRHQPSGRLATPEATATLAQLPRRLRSIFRNYK
jgi:serine/threonine protein kinase